MCVLTSSVLTSDCVPLVVCIPNYPLVGTTSPLIPSFESCNSPGGLSGPRLVSFPCRLSGLHLPEVLIQGGLSTCRGATGTSRAMESACMRTADVSGARARHALLLTPDPNPVVS